MTRHNERDTAGQYSVPEPGQLVEVRRRQWAVSDIQGSAFDAGTDGDQHLVTLASLDEDSLGEELQVIWQLEPGAQILEKAGFPEITGCDSPDRQEAFLDAVRWGATTNADRSFLQAPFRSGISIEDYQLDPLVRAIDMARVNLLIADDVGLGKTIEAGLVIQEMLVRHRARTVFVVCPASLQVKWQTEMWEKFGLEFRIVDTEYIKRMRRERGIHANPWTSFPRLISSVDWFKSGEGLRLIKDALPPHITYPRQFDILVVDEAHNVAPAAAIRFVSCEPLLGPIDLAPYFGPQYEYLSCGRWIGNHAYLDGGGSSVGCCPDCGNEDLRIHDDLHWVIVGGETGPGARPMHPDWVRSIRDQCVEAKVPFFFKSWGAYTYRSYDENLKDTNDQESRERALDERHILLTPRGTEWVIKRDGQPRLDTVIITYRQGGRLVDGKVWEQYPPGGKALSTKF